MRIDLLASLLLFGLTVEGGGIIRPKECYTCQSTLESNICGEGNIFPNFMTKYCTVNQFYCIKVIEKAGRTPLVYRKCSHYDCAQEKNERTGEIIACSICSDSLCNSATVSSTLSFTVYLLMMAIVYYHLKILSLLDQS
ncbi:uncharacterized protein [Halyomorpha halys]|uniref:uncharacterized protein isoform X1 n=1 Tax=Halyomorpha halys TaxID=286706 RepID=UPI0006D4C7B2|nr:uncharacterized protein LOC106677914 isoform X1 [Halyomorpha halys]